MNPKNPIDPEVLSQFLANMNISQLNAWNKRQRKGQARLKQFAPERAAQSALELRNEKAL